MRMNQVEQNSSHGHDQPKAVVDGLSSVGTPNQSRLCLGSSSYNLGFIGASLRPQLVRIIAEYYREAGDWELAKERILASNALQSRNARSALRVERELRQRLGTLTHDQLALLAQATLEDCAAISWLAACKHVQFAFEFAVEILREKLAEHDPILRHSDYETYVESKSPAHPELARLTSSTKNKVRQVLLRMLNEVGLLVPGEALGTIQRPVLSPAVVRVISNDNPKWLAGFLVPDTEIMNLGSP